MKFLDVFEPIEKGNFALTDEAIYRSIQSGGNLIPIWGGNKEHNTIDRLISENGRTKDNEPITIFDGEGIIISLDGSSGCLTYKINQKFALNHHAGFFRLKKGCEKVIIPEFFVLFYQKQLQESSISEGSGTLSTDTLYSMDFDIPSYQIQEKIMMMIKPLLEKKTKVSQLLHKINSIKEKEISDTYQKYQDHDVPISKVLDYARGNTGLTSEVIYQKINQSGERYIVLSASTDQDSRLGEIPLTHIRHKPLEVFENKEGILVSRIGVGAGTISFVNKGKYTITDNAYILYLKDDYQYEISLKWLMIQYRKTFFEYTSTSDYSTWNMTRFFENMIIDIPSFNEQIEVVKKWEQLDVVERRLNQLLSKIDEMFTKQIII